MERRLQVFFSSTYLDLKEERQAAVEAILEAKHIPAGMELFAAGNDSLLEVIKRWIDESDVFMLILGHRYGSIEPKSGKSYTHVEYDYAVSKGKPVFAVVMTDGWRKGKQATVQDPNSLVELENPKELKAFRKVVMERMYRNADDRKDIKLAVHQALVDFVIRTRPRRTTTPAAAPPPAPATSAVPLTPDRAAPLAAEAAPFERGVPKPAFDQPVLPATVTGPSGALRRPPDGTPINAGPASTLPPPLVAAHKARRLVPFVGAGLSLGPDVGGRFSTWRALPGRLLDACDKHLVWADDRDRLTLRARFLEPDPADPRRERPRPMPLDEMLRQLDQVKDKLGLDYATALTALFRPRDARPGAAHAAVMALDAPAVLTSNYDLLLEAADSARQRYTHRQATTALSDLRDGRPVLFKVHGSAEDAESVVLTLDEYRAAHADRKYQTVMRNLLADRSFLFVGYGMSDPHDLDVLLAESVTDLKGSSPLHFALLPRLADEQAEVDRRAKLRREHRVVVIPYDDRDGHREATELLRALAAAP